MVPSLSLVRLLGLSWDAANDAFVDESGEPILRYGQNEDLRCNTHAIDDLLKKQGLGLAWFVFLERVDTKEIRRRDERWTSHHLIALRGGELDLVHEWP